MKHRLICTIAMAAMLGACNQTAAPTAGASPDAPGKAGASRQEGKATLEDPMFDGYRPSFRYALRADKVGEGREGQTVRRVVLEYFGDDREKLVAALDRDMKNLGYAPKAWREEEGHFGTQYVKKGASRVGVTITPASSALPTRSPGAKGFVKFVWVAGAR
jgi:hypothetical protein